MGEEPLRQRPAVNRAPSFGRVRRCKPHGSLLFAEFDEAAVESLLGFGGDDRRIIDVRLLGRDLLYVELFGQLPVAVSVGGVLRPRRGVVEGQNLHPANRLFGRRHRAVDDELDRLGLLFGAQRHLREGGR